MQVSNNIIQNNPSNVNFKGRIQFRNEGYIAKTIDKMKPEQLSEIEQRLNSEIQRNLPRVKNNLFTSIRNLFGSKPPVKKPFQPKSLNELWADSINEIKALVKTKLSDEYVLRNSIPSSDNGSMSFVITKGKERIGAFGASIENPLYPQKRINEVVGIVSSPKFKQDFQDSKNVFPSITEGQYFSDYPEFSSRGGLGFIKDNKKLQQKAMKKGLRLSTVLANEEIKICLKARATLTDKNNNVIYKTGYFPDRLKIVNNEIARNIKQYKQSII